MPECYGISVHHCPYCDGWRHRDQRIAVYGSDVQAAAGLALALTSWSRELIVLTNGQQPDGDQCARLARHQIDIVREAIAALAHERGQLTAIELAGGRRVPADALFFHTGQRPACTLPRLLGVACDGSDKGRTDRKQKTSVPGVFLAGDADGDVQFAIVAAAESATAAVVINRELQDEDLA